MVTKRAQTRQSKNLKKTWMQQAPQNLNSASNDTPNLIQNTNLLSENLNELPPELQNLSPEQQLAALEMMSELQDQQRQQPPQKLKSVRLVASSRKPQNQPTSFGESGADETPGSDLEAPLTGKHLKQEKELKGLAGAVCMGLVAASKAAKSQSLMADAHTVAKYGEEVAHAWAVLGRKYSWLYDVIDRVCAGSIIAVMLAPMSAMLSEIANNHGVEIPLIGKKAAAA